MTDKHPQVQHLLEQLNESRAQMDELFKELEELLRRDKVRKEHSREPWQVHPRVLHSNGVGTKR